MKTTRMFEVNVNSPPSVSTQAKEATTSLVAKKTPMALKARQTQAT